MIQNKCHKIHYKYILIQYPFGATIINIFSNNLVQTLDGSWLNAELELHSF